MASYNVKEGKVFDQILAEAAKNNIIPGQTQAARNWFRERANDVPEISEDDLLDDYDHRLVTQPQIGSMYLFRYDPKTKEELPYYDKFPLVIPIEPYHDGFLGLNLHYLPQGARARLMDNLYKITTNTQFDATTKIRASYQLLNSVASFLYFKPCVKRYLYSFVDSRFLLISPVEWDIALFLPLERFEKASSTRIHNDSLSRIGRKKKRIF